MAVNAEDARERLEQGNRRFVAGTSLHPRVDPGRRRRLEAGQQPFAAILACADARTPPELIFDQGLGDLFVVRVAGNVASRTVTGSLEFAVGQLGVEFILVLGHQGCGAVAATLAGAPVEGSLGEIVEAIRPEVAGIRDPSGDGLEQAVRHHALAVAQRLRSDEPVLASAVRDGRLRIDAGYYNLASGVVELWERVS